MMNDKKIVSFESNLTKSYPRYNVLFEQDILDDEKKELYKYLRLSAMINTSNMHLMDKNFEIKKI